MSRIFRKNNVKKVRIYVLAWATAPGQDVPGGGDCPWGRRD
jgi:hypothetical protein